MTVNVAVSEGTVVDLEVVSGQAGPPGNTGATGATGVEIAATAPLATDVLWADTSEPGDAAIPAGGTTGQLFTKDSAADYDASWSYLEPRAVPTRSDTGAKFFGIPFNSLQTAGVFLLAGSRPNSHYSPFIVRDPITIEELAYQVTATPASPSQISVNIYDADEDWQPILATQRVMSAAITHTAINVTTVTGLSETLQPGKYLTEVFQQDMQTQLRSYGCAVEGLAVMNFGANPQISGRALVRLGIATAGALWTGNVVTFNGGGVSHFVLYKWSLA